MNIIHLLRKPQIGGAEVLVKNIINANSSKRFQHYLLFSEEGPLLELINESRKENLIKCPAANLPKFIKNFRKAIISTNARIIHTHQPIDAVYAIVATIGLNVVIVRTYHGYEGIYNAKKSMPLKSKLVYFLINKCVKLNLFVSKDLLSYYRKRNPGQSETTQRVLYNGIDSDSLKKEKKTDILNELNLPLNSILLGMTGSFRRARDQLTICKAFKEIVSENPNCHFLFIGKNAEKNVEQYNSCLAFCKKHNLFTHVHFLGQRHDIGGILKNLRIYVHSSNNDTFGLALVEAMLSNVPCVASDIPSFREVSHNGKYVLLFERGNIHDLTKKLREVLFNLNSGGLDNKSKTVYDFALSNFSIQAHLKLLHQYYSET